MEDELTHKIIGCAFEVLNELGTGFLESVYEKSLIIALEEAGLSVDSQQLLEVHFRNQKVGTFIADLIVEESVLIELKAVKSISPEHKAQLINYLQATRLEIGLLLNFGGSKLEFNRLTRKSSANKV